MVILLSISLMVPEGLSLEKHLVVGIAYALKCGTRHSIFRLKLLMLFVVIVKQTLHQNVNLRFLIRIRFP